MVSCSACGVSHKARQRGVTFHRIVNQEGQKVPINYPNLCEETARKFCPKIKSFEVKDDDIFLVGIPKSGTTWAQEMIWLIKNDLDYEGAKEYLHIRFPTIEKSGIEVNLPRCYEPDSIEFCKNMRRPRAIKTHLSPEYLPEQLLNDEKEVKTVYIARNVKDVCLSTYYYFRDKLNLNLGSLEHYGKVMMRGTFPRENYWNHVLYLWNRRYEKNILFIKYEDMKSDLRAVIRKVSTFLGKSLTMKQEEELVKWLDFESFKKNDAVNQVHFYKKDGFVRKGKIGGYKEEMSPELILEFDKWSNECLKNSDYKYD
ncbi:hypothetical protein RI129_001711 [Pyrocoelia pectoralis]|uniref:Sulfotransferase domain-containing protein n=1 Tax=Pyrocoelia pectoralis TaxID=417401 RepID=A0AAN7VL53_9COLE